VSIGDLDGDDDPDALATNSTHGNGVWLNDGSGAFAPGGVYPGEGTEKVDLADVEGDGDLDAFTTNQMLGNKIWLNDGHASFTPIGSQFGTYAMSITAATSTATMTRYHRRQGLRPRIDQRLFQHDAQRRGRRRRAIVRAVHALSLQPEPFDSGARSATGSHHRACQSAGIRRHGRAIGPSSVDCRSPASTR